MIEPISHNAILASMFGATPARPVFARIANAGGEKDSIGGASRADVYPQPTDSAEFSTRIFGAPLTTNERNTTDRVAASSGTRELSDEEQAEVRELKQRDQEVRRHEQAHKGAAGSHATGGPSFEYTTGPDGKRYAVGGEVNIDTSEVPGDPQATIAKMQQIRSAAQAPANPSSQDRAVANQAAATERAARAELAEQRRTDSSDETDANPVLQTGSNPGLTGQGVEPRSPATISSTTTGALLDLIA